MTRSNLTQVKENITIEWYKALSPCSKQALTQLAIKNKRTVLKQHHIEEIKRRKKRQKAMKQSYVRRTAIREKQAKEIEYLSHQHLIKTEQMPQPLKR